MCGFLTFFGNWQEHEGELITSLQNMRHRGPDDTHVISGKNFWIGFNRLAILDTSSRGRQPMTFAEERYILVFNGEIYNFKQLAKLLNTSLKSNADSEVLGNCLLEFGLEETLKKLRGMFAFVFYDKLKNKVAFARDHFGIKPLYYLNADNKTILASEFRAIYSLKFTNSKIDANNLPEYFSCGAIGTPNTLSTKINSLEPATYGELTNNNNNNNNNADNKLIRKTYWQPHWNPAEKYDSAEMQAMVRDTVIESVGAHMISDVPLGLFLSGGLDSSIICACMKKFQNQVKAFSIGWSDSDGVDDESKTAESTAKEFGIDFHMRYLTSQKVYDKIDNFAHHLDLPTGDGLNSYLVSELASEHVTVALNGIGADEFAAGYGFHRMFFLANKFKCYHYIPEFLRAMLSRAYFSSPQHYRSQPLLRLLAMSTGVYGKDVLSITNNSRTVFTAKQIQSLLGLANPPDRRDLLNQHQSNFSEILKNNDSICKRFSINEMLFYEMSGYMLNTLLRDADNLSMAHSIELRVPLVDLKVFSALAKCPEELKLSASGGKLILRKSFLNMLPKSITQDTRKKGFNLPMMKWLKEKIWQDKISDLLFSQDSKVNDFCDKNEVRKYFEEFRNSEINSKLAFANYQRLWLIFILEIWLRKIN